MLFELAIHRPSGRPLYLPTELLPPMNTPRLNDGVGHVHGEMRSGPIAVELHSAHCPHAPTPRFHGGHLQGDALSKVGAVVCLEGDVFTFRR